MMMFFFLQFDAISNFSSWDVGAGKELEEDALILPRPNTVLKVKMTFILIMRIITVISVITLAFN